LEILSSSGIVVTPFVSFYWSPISLFLNYKYK
jgi:hypothetical protein